MLIRRAIALAAAAVAVAATAAIVSRTGPAGAAARPSLEWSDCSDGFQCASLAAPLDYHHPARQHVSLAMIKLPATDQAHRIGTLFVNFGGPGASGVDRLRDRGDWDWLFSPQVKERFDLVSWDTRGVYHSDPAVLCFDNGTDQAAFFNNQPPFPVGAEQEQKFYADAADLGTWCGQRNGSLLDHMSTADTARDLDLMRQAVGDTRLSYLGLSYGTNVGATYANLFPNKIRAMVLDGTLDFIGNATGHGDDGHELPIDTRQNVAAGITDTFGQFLSHCDAAGTPRCAFAGNASAKFAQLAALARQHPITADGQQWTYAGIIGTITSNLYHIRYYAGLASLLQDLYDAATGKAVTAKAAAVQQRYDNLSEAYYATNCADSTVPTDPAIYSRLGVTEDQRVPYFGPVSVFDYMPCAFWPGHDRDRYTGPWNRWTSAPILVVNNEFDPATPLAGARDATAELARGQLFVIKGATGHTGMYVPSACGEQVKRSYLIDGTMPGPNVTCTADDDPFPPVTAAKSAVHR